MIASFIPNHFCRIFSFVAILDHGCSDDVHPSSSALPLDRHQIEDDSARRGGKGSGGIRAPRGSLAGEDPGSRALVGFVTAKLMYQRECDPVVGVDGCGKV